MEPDSGAQVRLAWEDPETGRAVEWSGPLPATLGRDPENSLPLPGDLVSRRHASLEMDAGEVIVRDLGSRNGTFLNDTRVERAVLRSGDHLRVGDLVLQVEVPSAAEPAVTLAEEEPEGPAAPAAAEDGWTLRWTDPVSGQPHTVPVTAPLTLGRRPENDVVLGGASVSGQHARIEAEGEGFVVVDLQSTNGTFVNGRRCDREALRPGDTLQIGDCRIQVAGPVPAAEVPPPTAHELRPGHGTVVFALETDEMLPVAPAAAPAVDGFPPRAFERDVVSIEELRKTGLPVREVTYLAVGAGLGSFVWVDHLVIWGADPDQIRAVGPFPKPYGRYQVLTRNSQIPLHERIRSHSESAPDNIWGFPGYAAREGWRALGRGKFGRALQLLWQCLGENAVTQTYTPLIGDVFASLDREAARIGWDRMWRYGAVRAIRKTDDGRYVAACSQTSAEAGRSYRLVVAPYVHLAVGYPGIKLLADLQAFRERTGDYQTVVNAYEDHEHVYEHLRRHGGVILMRGRGIVASRILQRIAEVRRENPSIAVLHLMRSPVHDGAAFGVARRPVDNHWEFQQFNWPKSTWGGEYKALLERADDNRRKELLQSWGGTTTARRADWLHIVRSGLRQGWYQIRFGEVKSVERDGSRVVTTIAAREATHEEIRLEADYVIDCTGLESMVEDNPLLRDLVTTYHLQRNPLGRLKVANDFELAGMRHDPGRMYASGVMTLGGPLAGVDTFLGLQYAALQSVDALAGARAPGLRRLGTLGSLVQWTRWARGVKP